MTPKMTELLSRCINIAKLPSEEIEVGPGMFASIAEMLIRADMQLMSGTEATNGECISGFMRQFLLSIGIVLTRNYTPQEIAIGFVSPLHGPGWINRSENAIILARLAAKMPKSVAIEYYRQLLMLPIDEISVTTGKAFFHCTYYAVMREIYIISYNIIGNDSSRLELFLRTALSTSPRAKGDYDTLVSLILNLMRCVNEETPIKLQYSVIDVVVASYNRFKLQNSKSEIERGAKNLPERMASVIIDYISC